MTRPPLSPTAAAALQRARAGLARQRPIHRRRYWSDADREQLHRRYADEPTEALAKALGRSVRQVYAKAKAMGLRKSEAYLRKAAQEQGRRLTADGLAYRFSPGTRPWNAGLKGLSVNGRSRETQFKKGHRPRNWLPIGSTRITDDGYLQRKMTDTGYPPADWQAVHVLLWEEHHGPIPAGHCLSFRDGDKTNVTLENLELITRAERMRRNSIHRYPAELKSAIHAVGRLKRAIREVEREKQD